MSVSIVDQVKPERYGELGLTKELLVDMWERMALIRSFEEKVEELFLVKKILKGPSHLYIGQEAVAVGVMMALKAEDVIVSHYRGHGHAIARGVPPGAVMAELFGKSTGTCKGVGGSMHSPKYPELNLMYATAIVGSGIPIAAGMALTSKLRHEKKAVAVFFGDGAANIGAFHEGTNLAAIWKLPLVLVCENNQYAISMKADRATSGPGIAYRAQAYGIPGIIVDGNDVVAVYLAAVESIERARRGEGPTLLECRTYRIKGHGVYDVAQYRPKEEIESWVQRDPIQRFRKSLLTQGLVREDELVSADQEAHAIVEEAVRFAEASPMLSFDELHHLVYG